MNKNPNIIAHHSMAFVGGFFGLYALSNRSETFGSSATSNLIYLFASGLNGSYKELLIRIGAMLCYATGVAFATAIPHHLKNFDRRYISIGIDIICCLVLAQIPSNVNPVLALYPMLFATAFQWVVFSDVEGFSSATIFNTNNLRQCAAGLTEYLYDHNPREWTRFTIFGSTILCFHLGVIYTWFCIKQWGISSIYACIPILIICFILTYRSRKSTGQS